MRFFGLLAAAILLVGYASSRGRLNAAQDSSLEFSCAAFPADTTEADLHARFGARSVARAPVVGWDDAPTEGTVLFPERPDSRLQIRWRDHKSQRAPEWIAARGVADTWKTPSGIAVEMDLRQLERANQRPFRLAGLQTEIHGRVLSWAGGRLDSHPSNGCRINIYLQPRYDGTEDALIRHVRSGREYSSGHPAMQALNPRVVEMSLSYARR